MAKTVKRIWPFMWADYKSAEKYLEKMAAKGLMLKSLDGLLNVNTGLIATYEVTEPQKRKFCIDGFKGNMEDAERFITMAGDAGWQAVAADCGILICVSKAGENPIPLETDWENEYKMIRKSFRHFDLPVGLFSIVIFLIFMKEGFFAPSAIFESGISFALIFVFSVLLFGIVALGQIISFYIRSESAIKQGKAMAVRRERTAKFWGAVRSILGLTMALAFLGQVGTWIYEELADGDSYKTMSLIILGSAMGLSAILVRVRSLQNSSLVKKIVVALQIIAVIAIFCYCQTGCEVVVEG